MRLAVLLNGAAGDAAQHRSKEVAGAFSRLGLGVSPRLVPGAGMQQAAQEAVAGGADVVAVGGGDGTIGSAAGALAGTGVPLAVLPMGTLNHFAIDAGIPLGLDEAARVAVEGRAAAVDVAEVNGRVFVNNSSIGLYPRAVLERQRRPWSQGRWGKRLAMVAASWQVLKSAPTHRVVLDLDGRVTAPTTPFVFVGNNRYGTIGLQLGKRQSLTAGRLSVYSMRRTGPAAILALAARAAVGRLDGSRDFLEGEASEVTIRSRRPWLRVAHDGEVERMRTPLHYRARPRALLLMQDRQRAVPGEPEVRRGPGTRKGPPPRRGVAQDG